MPRLVAPGGLPPTSEKAFLGVALRYYPQSNQRHIGLVYRKNASDGPRLSHLRWHADLKDEEWPKAPTYHWQAVRVNKLVRPTVVAFLNFLRRTNPTPAVPYAFRHQGFKFEVDKSTKDVRFVADSRDAGLTCATYIECVFRSMSIPFLDMKDWPKDRAGDKEWRASIAAMLKARTETVAQGALVQSGGFDTRVRPEDVASAALQDGWPIGFDRVEPVANEICTEVGPSAQ
jgi:hypothetical protein